MSGNNSYSGGTTLSYGALSVSADHNLGASGGALTFDGGTLLATAGFSSSRAVGFTGEGTVEVSGGNNFTLSGVLSGSSNWTKSGSGTLVVTGNNTYTGKTAIGGGVLSGSANSISGGLELASGTSVIFDEPNDVIYAGPISGSGKIIKKGAGKLTISDASQFVGLVDRQAGLLDLIGRLNLTGANIQLEVTSGVEKITLLNGSGLIKLNNYGVEIVRGSFAGRITGSGGTVEKVGVGVLTLSGANTYSGGTKLGGGTLRLSAEVNLGSPSGGLAFDGGTLEISSSFVSSRNASLLAKGGVINVDSHETYTMSGLLSGTGSLEKKGEGTLNLSGNNTHTGTLIFSRGCSLLRKIRVWSGWCESQV